MIIEVGDKVRVKRGHHMNRRGVVVAVTNPIDPRDFLTGTAFVNLKIGAQEHGIEFMQDDLAKVAK